MKGKLISRTVWILSFVSLFTDMASEMLYPVMPVYLSSIGFSILLIGILEGLAEATAGLSKGYFGNLSDRSGKRLPFVQWGYALSAVSKPLMAIFVYPVWVFFVRSIDRLGKGLRTGARDAILSDEATVQTKARVFGFHRAMDTLGAVLGPLLALIYLSYFPEDYHALFLLAFLPGFMAILLLFKIKEKRNPVNRPASRIRFLDFLHYWKRAPLMYRRLVRSLLFFALFNSSDVFLLLKVKASGCSDQNVIMLYIFYNLVYALFSYPMGMLADRLGMKKVFITGLLMFAIVYAGMGMVNRIEIFYLLFFLYGLYAAATEGIAKAWITNLSGKENTATAIGTYTAFQSLASLLASSLAGFLWYAFGASVTFYVTALMTLLLFFFIIFFLVRPGIKEPEH